VANTLAYAVAPVIVAFLTVPDLIAVLHSSPLSSIIACCLFGLLWGLGNMMWGLSIRYLGLSLGYALSLGFTAAFGTIMPPIFQGIFAEVVSTISGMVTLSSVAVCLLGIAVCGWAGFSKERELSNEQKEESIKEFNFKKGIWVALLCGILSACFAFGILAGKPIAEQSLAFGTNPDLANNLVCMLILGGGAISNFIWCISLNIKNRTIKEYFRRQEKSLVSNYLLCALSGGIAYLGFMFYGMSTLRMGKYDFASWSIYMALIIAFSNIWGLIFHEWKGSSKRTLVLIFSGIFILVLSVIINGLGAYLASIGM
jgi:L-rhamnose-H+ transport protein